VRPSIGVACQWLIVVAVKNIGRSGPPSRCGGRMCHRLAGKQKEPSMGAGVGESIVLVRTGRWGRHASAVRSCDVEELLN
jgi:hypothetical protein